MDWASQWTEGASWLETTQSKSTSSSKFQTTQAHIYNLQIIQAARIKTTVNGTINGLLKPTKSNVGKGVIHCSSRALKFRGWYPM